MAWDDDKVAGNIVYSDDYDERTARIKASLGAADAVTFADQDTTPTVAGATVFYTANTVLTTITDFDDATEKVILIIAGDALTTIASNANIRHNAGADRVMGKYDCAKFIHNGVLWVGAGYEQNSA